MANCFFIEAAKLEKVDASDDITNDITIATVESDPQLNVKLTKDPTIFNISSPYMNIVDMSIDNENDKSDKN